MREVLIWLTFGAAGWIEAVTGQLLAARLLDGKRLRGKVLAACGAGGACIGIFCGVMGFSELFLAGAQGVWIGVWASRFGKTGIRESLFISIFYEIGVAFWQFLTAAGLAIVLGLAHLPGRLTAEGLAAVWVFHLLLGAAAFCLFRREQAERNGIRGASAVVAAGLIAVVTLSEQNRLTIPADTQMMWTVLAVVLLTGVLVFRMNRQYEMERELARLKAEQAQLLERDYTALNQIYETNARLFHDLHHHIGALRQLLEHGHYEEAGRYLDELQEPVREITDRRWTGEETVDFLINSKLAEADRDQICMEVSAEFPRHTGIRQADLCAILGNLLDNGLEAARKASDPERRFLILTIRRIYQMVVIKVENGYEQLPEEEKGRLKTTKSGGLHGWGLKSARAAAQKYDGTVVTTFGGGRFRAVATLSFQPALSGSAQQQEAFGQHGESQQP